jgi:hypothetical protein
LDRRKTRVSHWTILCDFDGTISVEDITDALLVRFAKPGWEDIEQAWKRGEIGSRECMARQIALLDATATNSTRTSTRWRSTALSRSSPPPCAKPACR